jgi:hypothetical protein
MLNSCLYFFYLNNNTNEGNFIIDIFTGRDYLIYFLLEITAKKYYKNHLYRYHSSYPSTVGQDGC